MTGDGAIAGDEMWDRSAFQAEGTGAQAEPDHTLTPMTRLMSAVLALFLAVPAASVAQPAAPPALTGPLPVDPAVTTGTLPNGLRYYVRRNPRPEKRVLAWLAVKTGSIHEADDQRGLAHLLEHMAFNGTKHFKPGELVSFFETAGARFGPHVNAYTSFDETVYMLQVPTDKEGLVDKALLALSDFAGGLSLEEAEVNKERGVVIEEWRLRQGASWRILEKQAPVLYYHSRYADRIPIGTPEILKSFPVSRLRDFYETWYRPDRMSVVVVGDIEPAAIVPKLTELFSPQKPTRASAAEPNRDVPDHAETLVNVSADVEAQASSVSVLHKQPKLSQGTVEDYRRDLVRQLMYQMLNLRFSEIAQRPAAPFLAAGAGSQELGSKTMATSLGTRVTDGGIAAGLEAVLVEARRAREFGFTDGELDRAKRTVIAGYERAFAEREKTESAGYAREYTGNFLDGEPIPGIAVEFETTKALLPGVTLAEVSGAARELLADKSRVVLATSPEKAGLTLPSDADVRAVLAKAGSAALTPWTETLSRTELLTTPPTPGTIGSRRTIDAIGVTVLTLSNGADVWLKQTDFKNDQVLFGAVSRGGASTSPKSEYLETVLAASLVSLGGVGGLKPPELAKILAGRMASAGAFIDLSTEGVRGGSRPQDLEAALQMLYLTFTAPNHNAETLDLLKRQLAALVANRQQNPQAVFGDRTRALNTGGSYLVQPITTDLVEQLRLDVMSRTYTERFANAANFSFLVVGAFDPATIETLVTTYIASLPSTGKRASADKPLDFAFPSKVETITVEQGKEPKGDTVITFFSDTGGKLEAETAANGAAALLQMRLRDILREQLGGTYSVSADYSNTMPSPGYGTTAISFGSAPENAERLTAEVLKEIARLAAEGPTEEDAQKVREQEKRELEEALKQNGYWLGALQSIITTGRDPAVMATSRARVDALTPATLKDAFVKYYPMNRYTVATLLPAPKPVEPVK
jgi:zinc protease